MIPRKPLRNPVFRLRRILSMGQRLFRRRPMILKRLLLKRLMILRKSLSRRPMISRKV